MIIKKLYIQDFGKLHEFTLDLNNGLNKINEENGWGKSTVSAFLKAILFGLFGNKKQDLDENERTKFTPWNKTKFGGYIDFELNGKNYRLERFFGTKQNQDSATLFDLDLNKVCQTFTPNIMEEFFNINCETFERTTYIAQGSIETTADDNIKSKLGNLLQNENEDNFKNAIELVLDLRKEKKPLKGKGGESEEIEQKINEITKKHSDALNKKEILLNKQSEADEIKKQIEKIEQEINLVSKQIKELEEKHSKNAEIEHLESLQQELEKLKNEYEENLKFFNNKIPDELTIERTQIDINNFNQKQAQLASSFDDVNKVEQESLNRFFAKHLPTDQEIEKYLEISKKVLEKENKQTFVPVIQQNNQQIIKTNYFVYSIIGLIAIIGGVALCAFEKILFGAIAGGFGLICFVVGIILSHKQKQRIEHNVAKENLNKQRQEESQNKQSMKNQHEIEQLKQSLQLFISMFMVPSSSPMIDLSIIKSNKLSFDSLKKQREKVLQQKNNLNQELISIKTELDKFFAYYFESQTLSYQNMLNTIEFKVANFKKLESDVAEQTTKIQEYIKLKNIDPAQKITQTDLQNYNNLKQQKIMLTEKLNNLNTLWGQNYANIKTLEQDVLNIDALENELKNLKEQSTEVSKQVEILDNVKLFLEKANETLTSKYLSPMTKSFLHYLNLLSNTEFPKIVIDTNLNVNFEQQGAMHNKKFLSTGYRDIVDLCLRFALIDTIFPNEKPTIILDDPFVNLDDKNTKNGLDLIEKIAQEKQIIYFSCHSSRA